MKKILILSNSRVAIVAILFLFSWCVEPYEFRVTNNAPTLVVEAYISDVSFDETLEYPSDGRFFEVSLKRTSDVTNVRDEAETGAMVIVEAENGRQMYYNEKWDEPGKYVLYESDFKAVPAEKYRLLIALADGEEYQSDWEMLPLNEPAAIGNPSFTEVEKPGYVYIEGEREIRDVKGIELYIDVPQNQSTTPIFYKWEFEPMWIYTATFRSQYSPVYKCWISSKQYLSGYVLHEDRVGGFPQKLAFIESENNDRVYKEFTLLISQYVMSEEYYNFWKELKEQSEKGGLFDPPPFNLRTNFKPINTNNKVLGYFGVVNEQAIRWNFSIDDLSYFVDDRTIELCNISYGPDGPGGPECYSCLEYPFGDATNIEPDWWENR